MPSSRASFVAIAFASSLFLAGCSEEDNPANGGDDIGEVGGIWTAHTDPAALIAAHAQATSERKIDAYKALLVQPGDGAVVFEFHPKPGDAGGLPWLEGDFWDYEAEIDMMTNMFDPNYSGSEAEPVQSIDMELTILSITDQGGGKSRVDCTATVLVLVGPNQGFFSDTRLLIDLVPVRSHLRIQRIEERERQKAASPGQSRAAEAESWANIKAVYRTR